MTTQLICTTYLFFPFEHTQITTNIKKLLTSMNL